MPITSNVTEQEYIELSNHFKNLYDKMKDQNKELKKLLIIAYVLFRIADEDSDYDLSEIGRMIFSESLDKYIFGDG